MNRRNIGGGDPIDVHVGACVRRRRKSLGLSQDKLADAVGLSFQQIQKYERGDNRISASKLYAIAVFLKTPVSVFFEGLAKPGEDGATVDGSAQAAQMFASTPEGIELAGLLPQIGSQALRRHIVEIIRALAHN
ncbi:transcriptional regulator [Caulobacter flavus]|uniref:Transcriptional regulator n=2 Tax=cellular organisms TaxID=131567 RepID=A0A2N5CPJ6_9CAUL|nr:helix-turn-helix transcriptional regulator [Caulobacter flavus]AYV49692.1 transcriptional regulator [Caulobacter flavus]PLR08870.1 transcriptional regulator [Caulobacter flavus]